MSRKRLQWQIFPSYLIITLVSLMAIAWYATVAIRSFYVTQMETELLERVRLLQAWLNSAPDLSANHAQEFCRRVGQADEFRVTLIGTQGEVLADSEHDARDMENHADRLEVRSALSGQPGLRHHYSQTLKQNMMYAALPLDEGPIRRGVIRVAIPLHSIDKLITDIRRNILIAGLLVAGLVSIVTFFVSRRIVLPLEKMKSVAERFARGDLRARLLVPESDEIGALALAMNSMATQLEERMKALIRQRNESEVILESMQEGVLAVNPEGELIWMNHSAAGLFDASPIEALGRNILEVIRNTKLNAFIQRALQSTAAMEEEIVLEGKREKYLQAHGAVMRDAGGQSLGVLIVLNDMTRLHRLENIRREFVANVSHELKTPITSIKGFVETLLDGGMDDRANARRFLEIIAKHADRLNSIIEDLLSLSRIEQDSQSGLIARAPAKVGEMLAAALQVCQAKISAKHIQVRTECPDGLVANVNARLIEQAVVNLIDNAVKYSEPGRELELQAEARGDEVILRVIDHGCGIDREHLSRLFERFYRVDKARSRDMGGTGLGLAIVKHILQAHGGRVDVESEPGRGSVFRLHLPAVLK